MLKASDFPFYIFIGVLVIILLLLSSILKIIETIKKDNVKTQELAEPGHAVKVFRNILLYLIPSLIVSYFVYYLFIKDGLESHVIDWFNLIVRWAHVVLGIAWIGASFYFIFLENSLNRTENLREELAGNLWAIHGGGFYYVEKYKVAPNEIPKTLHWFKYEAYFTWLSGFLLLCIVYYLNAKTYLIDPEVRDITPTAAIAIGVGSLLSGWLLYDLMCKSSLIYKKKLFAIIGFLIIVGFAFFLSKMLSGRAAFIHIGALIGTIMVGNVFFVIIPAQKAMVKAAKEGKSVNPELGKFAGLRSLHNNYLTLPVIFVMISNHFPATFGNQFNWAILAGLTLVSVAARHYINLYEKGKKAIWIIPFVIIGLISLVIVTAPVSNKKKSVPVSFSEVQPVFQKRCVACHSAHPTDDTQKIAPNGITFDTPEQIKKHVERILVRVVQTKTMPQANKTKITEAERDLIGQWIEQGAKIN